MDPPWNMYKVPNTFEPKVQIPTKSSNTINSTPFIAKAKPAHFAVFAVLGSIISHWLSKIDNIQLGSHIVWTNWKRDVMTENPRLSDLESLNLNMMMPLELTEGCEDRIQKLNFWFVGLETMRILRWRLRILRVCNWWWPSTMMCFNFWFGFANLIW